MAAGLPVILQDGSGSFIYGRGQVSAVYSSGYQTFLLRDGLGSTQGVTGPDGALISYYAYEAFGGIRVFLGYPASYFLFAGEERDPASNFDYLGPATTTRRCR